MAKQLYDYWFVQFDFPNEEGKPYKSSGGAMVWNEKLKREIPQGWNFCFLEDLLTIRNGRDHKHLAGRMVYIQFMVAVVKCVKYLNIYMMENQY